MDHSYKKKIDEAMPKILAALEVAVSPRVPEYVLREQIAELKAENKVLEKAFVQVKTEADMCHEKLNGGYGEGLVKSVTGWFGGSEE
jgi:hypothetical protein